MGAHVLKNAVVLKARGLQEPGKFMFTLGQFALCLALNETPDMATVLLKLK